MSGAADQVVVYFLSRIPPDARLVRQVANYAFLRLLSERRQLDSAKVKGRLGFACSSLYSQCFRENKQQKQLRST